MNPSANGNVNPCMERDKTDCQFIIPLAPLFVYKTNYFGSTVRTSWLCACSLGRSPTSRCQCLHGHTITTIVHAAKFKILEKSRNNVIFVKHCMDGVLKLGVVSCNFLHKLNAEQRLTKCDTDNAFLQDISMDETSSPYVGSYAACQQSPK